MIKTFYPFGSSKFGLGASAFWYALSSRKLLLQKNPRTL
jgi:hypothetical protein